MTDAHCHLQTSDIATELQSCKENGVTRLICAGYDIESSKKAIEIAADYPEVYATVGVHPGSQDVSSIKYQVLRELAKEPKVVAIGETGLDFVENTTNEEKNRQIDLFNLNIKLARETRLPLVIHNRNANREISSLLNTEYRAPNIEVMLHCFTGNKDFMLECINRGWYISFGGILTFKKSAGLREVARLVPDDKLLIETDSPYLSPEPFREKPNSPKNVKMVAQMLADLRSTSIDRIEEITDMNVKKLFGVPHPA